MEINLLTLKHKLIMKTIAVLICFFGILTLNAQIEMNSSGRVSIGNINPASSTYELTSIDAQFTGTTFFDCSYTSYDLKFVTYYDGSYYFKALMPSVNNKSKLGSSTTSFAYMYSYNFTTPSDGRKKENVRAIDGSLEIVKSLSGVRFDFKPENFITEEEASDPILVSYAEENRKNNLGFIAQDVYGVLPEVVQYDDSLDMYSMDYTKIIPVLVEAIKEHRESFGHFR